MSQENDENFSSSEESSSEHFEVNIFTVVEDDLRDRYAKKDTGRYITQFYAMVVACLGCICFGTNLGWSHPLLESNNFIKTCPTIQEMTWITSMTPLGCAIGAGIWPYFTKTTGPKKTMIFQIPVYIFCWGVLATTQNHKLFMVSRFFCGFFSISYVVCGENLMQDCVHKANHEHMVIFFKVSPLIGVLIINMMHLGVNAHDTALLSAILAAIHLTLLLVVPESPVFLAGVSMLQAESALKWYQGPHNFYSQIREIRKHSHNRRLNESMYRYIIFQDVVLKAVLMCMMIAGIRAWSGYDILIFYDIYTWFKQGTDQSRTNEPMSFIPLMILFKAVGTYIHFRVYKKYGIKIPMIISCFLVMIILASIGSFFYTRKVKGESYRKDWFPFLAIILYLFFMNIGLNICPDIILSEYVPHQAYRRSKTIIRITQWLANFLLIKYYVALKATFSTSGLFFIFSCIMLYGTIFCIHCLIETKGKSLLQIQMILGGNPIGTRGRIRHY